MARTAALCAAALIIAGCASNQQEQMIIRGEQKRALPIQRSQVEFTTNQGTFVVLLFHNEAPFTVENFREYVRDGFYDGTLFHRVIPDFMIQGGGMTRVGQNIVEKETRAAIRNEASNGLRNRRGTIAMARTADRDSARAQFYINLQHNPELDHGVEGYGYTVFGRVISGMDVVDRIAAVPTSDTRRFRGLPDEDVIIVSARALRTEEFVEPETQERQQEGRERRRRFLGIF